MKSTRASQERPELEIKEAYLGLLGVQCDGASSFPWWVERPLPGRSPRAQQKTPLGTSPADLPVEEPTQFSLGVNLATAKTLGVMIPPMLLARPDFVVE
jgi:hypothetical protein